ncbi:MAG: hypothetical protein PHD68_11275 [Rugosibacter sp.]|nr:hypothetical protein [Rugosibacter sp.]
MPITWRKVGAGDTAGKQHIHYRIADMIKCRQRHFRHRQKHCLAA